MTSPNQEPARGRPRPLSLLRLAGAGILLILLLLVLLQVRQFDEAFAAAADQSHRSLLRLTFGLEALLLLLLAAAAWVANRSMAAKRAAMLRLADLSTREQTIFDAATDAMIIHDPKGRIESVNPAAAALFGYSVDALVGQNVSIFKETPGVQEEVEAYLVQLADNPQSHANVREFPSKRRDGSIFTADVVTSPVPRADGLHFLDVVRDMTERKRIEQMKTEFVSTVSHELRTPLTSIAGSLGLLAAGVAGKLPERAVKLIGIAHTNSERLVRLINDILDIEKIESGKMMFDIAPVSLRSLVELAIQANLSYAEKYGVQLRMVAQGGDLAVLADADRLMQVLTNLMSNAAKFSPPGESVVVTIIRGDKSHRITVADKGPGIPDDFRERIFSKFAQADSSDTRQKGGTGLGLSIVREIVTRLGGSVSFESVAGRGTSFHVDLPAAPALPSSAKRRRRILICQDDGLAADQVGRSLREAGFESDVAASIDEVLMLTAKTRYAAILLDLSLPGEESIGLIRKLRSDPRYASTAIVVSAQEGASSEISQALAVVDWLHEPVPVERLVAGGAEAIAARKQASILHVEDDPDILRVVSAAFEGHAELTSAVDLESARAALNSRHYDLVILDLALPGGSGLELLSEMRRDDGKLIPVVIFSARDDDPEIANRVEAMLTKSRASLDDLVATVETLIDRDSKAAKGGG
jgi:PAS domain S-box-containing protein